MVLNIAFRNCELSKLLQLKYPGCYYFLETVHMLYVLKIVKYVENISRRALYFDLQPVLGDNHITYESSRPG